MMHGFPQDLPIMLILGHTNYRQNRIFSTCTIIKMLLKVMAKIKPLRKRHTEKRCHMITTLGQGGGEDLYTFCIGCRVMLHVKAYFKLLFLKKNGIDIFRKILFATSKNITMAHVRSLLK